MARITQSNLSLTRARSLSLVHPDMSRLYVVPDKERTFTIVSSVCPAHNCALSRYRQSVGYEGFGLDGVEFGSGKHKSFNPDKETRS